MPRPLASILARWHALDAGRRLVAGATVALLALLSIVCVASLRLEYVRTVDAALARDDQTALRLATSTARTLDEVEQSLRLLALLVQGAHPQSLQELAASGVLASGTTRSIVVTDAAGRVVDSTSEHVPLSVSDEEGFKRVRASAGDGLEIGAPVRNPLTGEWSVPAWRRIARADGNFAGVVLAQIDPAALIGPGLRAESARSVVTILGSDGIVRSRLAGDGTLSVGARADARKAIESAAQVRRDHVAHPSPVDGRARFVSVVDVPRYPLHAFVGTDAETALPLYAVGRAVTLRWMGVLVAIVVTGAVMLWSTFGRLEASRLTALRTQRQFRAAIEGSMDAVTILAAVRGPDGRIADMTITDINSGAAEMIGSTRESLVGRRIREVMPHIADEGFLRAAAVAIRDRRVVSGEIASTDPRLEGRWMHHQVVPLENGAALIVRDVTDAKEQSRKLAALARFDSLTGLPNRRHFEESLTLARARALRSGLPLALLYIDLDGFKAVNDTFGHEGGDLLLQGVALRLLESVRATDLVARLGGDEFVVLLEAAGGEDDLREICDRVLASLSLEHRIEDHPVTATPSIGAVVLAGDEGEESLRRRADEAMYDAKRAGKGRYRLVPGPVVQEEAATA
jgi:diguanylate cyclase (GGDEF)-like protein/PAS domain S-box-containing protein